MSEQFGIDRSFRDCATVYCNISTVLTGTIGMNNLWKDLLSHATFTGNQYRQIGRCNPHRHLQRLVEGRIITDDVETLLERR